jgi:hypothetical protein
VRFSKALAVGSYVTVGITVFGAIVAALFLPSRPKEESTVRRAET